MGRFSYGSLRSGFSPIIVTAAVSVIALLAVVGWSVMHAAREKEAAATLGAQSASGTNPLIAKYVAQQQQTSDTASSSDPSATSTDLISDIGPAVMGSLENSYAQLQAQGSYTADQGQTIAQNIAPLVDAQISYKTFSATDIKTEPGTSNPRVLAYRSDLREALAPLLQNTEPEYEIFAYYVQTNDPKYLTQLASVAQNYRDAADASAKVVVPADAVPYQVAILNAMEEFAATLDAMGAHASDPFASVALLRTYDQAQSDMITSFNNLASYYKSKTP